MSIKCLYDTKLHLVNIEKLKIKKLRVNNFVGSVLNLDPTYLKDVKIQLSGPTPCNGDSLNHFGLKEWTKLMGTQTYPNTVLSFVGSTISGKIPVRLTVGSEFRYE